MSTPLTVNGTLYNFPTSGQDPNWGNELSGWATDVTFVLQNVLGTGDIVETSATIANNQSAAADVIGLKLVGPTVKHATIKYAIFRQVTSGTAAGYSETGTITASFNEYGTAGNFWELAHEFVGDSQVSLSITDVGQLQYLSTNLAGTAYAGTIKFSAIILNRT